MRCCFCKYPTEGVVCDACTLKIISQTDDFHDLLFLVAELVTCDSISETMEAVALLAEVFNRLQAKCQDQGAPLPLTAATKRFKREYIRNLLINCRNDHTKVAEILQVQRTYVSRLIRELELDGFLKIPQEK